MSDALPEVIAVRDAEFRRYQHLLLKETGIHLPDSKKALLAGRLARRLRALGLASYGRYFERVRADAAERTRMIDLVLTNETSFFREGDQFSFIKRVLVPMWQSEAAAGKRRRSLRIWSAGCATGEEPYSAAMLLHSEMDGWALEILATDLSTSALQQAEQGLWPIARAADIPDHLLERYMLRGVGERAGLMKIDQELRRMVRFRRVNLSQPEQSPSGPFDLLFCRNVLIYFENTARRAAVQRLIAACAPNGYLFVGHAESLKGYDRVQAVQPTIWRRTP